MATTLIQFPANAFRGDNVPVTAGDLPAYFASVNDRIALLFPDGANESAAVTFAVEMPQAYAGGTLTAKIGYITGATSGGVRLEAQVEAVTEADAVDLDSATSFDSANAITETVPATAGHLGVAEITLTNKDSVAASDMVRFLIRRDSDHANDDAAANFYLLWLAIQES